MGGREPGSFLAGLAAGILPGEGRARGAEEQSPGQLLAPASAGLCSALQPFLPLSLGHRLSPARGCWAGG